MAGYGVHKNVLNSTFTLLKKNLLSALFCLNKMQLLTLCFSCTFSILNTGYALEIVACSRRSDSGA